MDESGARARINIDRCVGCGTCIPSCPFNALVKEKRS
jgi:ferredoxin